MPTFCINIGDIESIDVPELLELEVPRPEWKPYLELVYNSSGANAMVKATNPDAEILTEVREDHHESCFDIEEIARGKYWLTRNKIFLFRSLTFTDHCMHKKY